MEKKFNELERELKNNKFHSLYLLYGNEPFFIDRIANYIEENALSEAEQGFNQTVLYGKDTKPIDLLDILRRYPMMGQRQVVILKEAQDMKGWQDLENYFANPMSSTIFVICYKKDKFDKRTKLYKNLKQNGVIMESKKLYDNKIPGWIQDHVKEKGLAIEDKACQLLTQYLGTDLAKISGELEKLELNIEDGATITTKDIERNIGISKDYNVFELTNSLAHKDAAKAFEIVHYFSANPKNHPIVMTLGALYNYFSNVYLLNFVTTKGKKDYDIAAEMNIPNKGFLIKEYKTAAQNYGKEKLETIIDLLHHYDMKSKGVENRSATDGALLKELVFRILN